MKMLKQIIESLLNQCNDYIMEYWWYFLAVFIGGIFRYNLPEYKDYFGKMRVKKICKEIGFVIFLTYFCNIFDGNISDYSIVLCVLIVLIFIYCIYVTIRQLSHSNSESILLIIKNFMITGLCFMPFSNVFNCSYLVMIVAMFIYFVAYEHEQKSDLWEIIILCIEIPIISIYTYFNDFNNIIQISALVIFVETFIFMFNYIVKFIIKIFCNEDVSDYWEKIFYDYDRY